MWAGAFWYLPPGSLRYPEFSGLAHFFGPGLLRMTAPGVHGGLNDAVYLVWMNQAFYPL